MRQLTGEIRVPTRARSFADITSLVRDHIAEAGVGDGLMTLFVRHTSASIIVQENADPDVLADLGDALARLAPEDAPWRHDAEGPDDMPAHVKSALTATSLSVPIIGGEPALGTWQAIYVIEHRARDHERRVAFHIFGE